MLGVRVIFRAVIGGSDEEIVRWRPFCAQPICEDIFVIVFGAGVQIFAEPVACIFCNRAANRKRVAYGGRSGYNQIGLIIRSEIEFGFQIRFASHPPRDVFDRAADCVAAIQSALWTPQDFDPINVEYIQYRALRSRDVDVVNIQPNAWFKAPKWILLTDSSDERDQC